MVHGFLHRGCFFHLKEIHLHLGVFFQFRSARIFWAREMLKFSARNSRKKVVYDTWVVINQVQEGWCWCHRAVVIWCFISLVGLCWARHVLGKHMRGGSVAGPKRKRKACNDKQVIYLKQIYPIGYCIISFIVHLPIYPIYNACIISGGTLLVLNKKVGFSLSHPQVFLPQWPHKCRASETPRWKTTRFP